MQKIASSFLQLWFPHCCLGCSSDYIQKGQLLCGRCIHQLPATGFFDLKANPVERIFYGRLRVENAAAGYYFTKNALIQHLLVQLKYRGNKDVGLFLGRMIGRAMHNSTQYKDIDFLVPLPLNPKKEFKRGYNQAELICRGIQEITGIPILKTGIQRRQFTESQTSRNRINRWQNMETAFEVNEREKLVNKHVLLVDDVITTGATIEACGSYILEIPGTRLSIAAAAYTI